MSLTPAVLANSKPDNSGTYRGCRWLIVSMRSGPRGKPDGLKLKTVDRIDALAKERHHVARDIKEARKQQILVWRRHGQLFQTKILPVLAQLEQRGLR